VRPSGSSCLIAPRSSISPIHVTGGFIDPGFKGTITLEFVNLLPCPIRMWPGRKIGQVCFMKMVNSAKISYGDHPDRQNRYQGQQAATAARRDP
jgi:dCTP deaminase